jgi:GMP synthase-like glutamine amidotransferase
MKVAILQCDEVMPKLQPLFGQYKDMIRTMFEAFVGPFEFDCFDCQKERYPVNLHSYDFYITTGSKASVYEDKPWIKKLIKFVQLLSREKKKLIGICFGHQIIAVALNGEVEKSDKGWGVGVGLNSIAASPGWMSEKSGFVNILSSHQDQITILPEKALIIAGGDFCPYFIIQWNDYFLSIQGHPEWSREYSRALINERRAIITPGRIEPALASLTTRPDNQLFVRWIIDFVNFQPTADELSIS